MDEKGETRRQRNERFGVGSPDVTIPEEGVFLWETFWRMSALRSQGMGGPDAIRPDDMRGWASLTGTIIRRQEYGILLELDAAYRSSMSEEIAANDARRQAEKSAG